MVFKVSKKKSMQIVWFLRLNEVKGYVGFEVISFLLLFYFAVCLELL